MIERGERMASWHGEPRQGGDLASPLTLADEYVSILPPAFLLRPPAESPGSRRSAAPARAVVVE